MCEHRIPGKQPGGGRKFFFRSWKHDGFSLGGTGANGKGRIKEWTFYLQNRYLEGLLGQANVGTRFGAPDHQRKLNVVGRGGGGRGGELWVHCKETAFFLNKDAYTY